MQQPPATIAQVGAILTIHVSPLKAELYSCMARFAGLKRYMANRSIPFSAMVAQAKANKLRKQRECMQRYRQRKREQKIAEQTGRSPPPPAPRGRPKGSFALQVKAKRRGEAAMRARATRFVRSSPRPHHDQGFELFGPHKQPAATGLPLLERTGPCAAAQPGPEHQLQPSEKPDSLQPPLTIRRPAFVRKQPWRQPPDVDVLESDFLTNCFGFGVEPEGIFFRRLRRVAANLAKGLKACEVERRAAILESSLEIPRLPGSSEFRCTTVPLSASSSLTEKPEVQLHPSKMSPRQLKAFRNEEFNGIRAIYMNQQRLT